MKNKKKKTEKWSCDCKTFCTRSQFTKATAETAQLRVEIFCKYKINFQRNKGMPKNLSRKATIVHR
jgi:hypothetical protein